jgi:mannose-1-phosphate guanylyltransferase/mannose-1-phosphate guanylyltransferase/mannose-6-phosphate isomerase
MNAERPIIPVLLCGGAGTRLWPLSRDGRSKQLLPMVSEETMLQATARRLPPGDRFSPPLVVAGRDHADEVDRQLAEVGVTARLIVEPCARNTAPAIALAALACAADDLLLVMPSDQLIGNVEAFCRAVDTASDLARQGWLVTFGVRPDRPATGYGYIKRSNELAPGLFEVERFVEKPDLATAEDFLRAGGYDWNAGIFLFRAGAYLAALKRFAQPIVAAASAALAAGRVEGDRFLPDGPAFARAPSISIDYAVMEKAERIAVAPVDMGWSDIGSWEALYDVSPKDEQGNVRSAEAFAIDSRGCLLRTTGPRVVVIGVEDLVVVATKDAVLVVPREQSQRVREALDRLAEPDASL